MSLKEVAQEVHVTSQLVAAWASGTRKIPLNHAQTLSKVFNVDVDDIMKEELFLEDKIQIEIQMNIKGRVPEALKEQIDLYNRYERLKQRYGKRLEDIKELEAENKALKETLKVIQGICQENI